MLSLTTDYAKDTGCPEPYLKRIAEAGFTHVHWCHQWNTDFLYAKPEVEQIGRWLNKFGLQLNDLHSPDGVEKWWNSPREYERLAGVELVKNRMEMTARLGGDVVIIHVSHRTEAAEPPDVFWTQLWKSLDDLEPCARALGVRLAIENDPFPVIRAIVERYDADYVGFCYDSGHANMLPDGVDQAEALKDRLLAIHLHDNDGQRDQHKPLFSGTIDWPRVARLLAASSYTKCVSMELSMKNAGFDDEEAFLRHALETGTKFREMVEKERADGGA